MSMFSEIKDEDIIQLNWKNQSYELWRAFKLNDDKNIEESIWVGLEKTFIEFQQKFEANRISYIFISLIRDMSRICFVILMLIL